MTKLIVNNGWSRKVFSLPTSFSVLPQTLVCANLQLVYIKEHVSSKIELEVLLVHYIVLDFVDY